MPFKKLKKLLVGVAACSTGILCALCLLYERKIGRRGMADFKDKLQAFLDHYETLNSIGEEAEEGFNSEFVVSSVD